MDKSGRPLKAHYPNSIHHVMMRGNNRQNIFFAREYYEKFLQILEEAASRFDHKVLAYCLMTNHIHLAIQVGSSSLSQVIQNIAYRYVRWINKKLNRIGHLFQGRYLSKFVHDDENLINLCRYIHLNPISAKMTKTASEYPWSSHRYYLFNNAPNWIDISVMGSAIRTKTKLTYHEFMSSEPNREKWLPAFHVNDDGAFIIDDSVMRTNQRVSSDLSYVINNSLSLEHAVEIVASFLETSIHDLKSLDRTRLLSRKRALIAFFALQHSATTITEIGRFFNRSATAMQKQFIKVKENRWSFIDEKMYQRISDALKTECES